MCHFLQQGFLLSKNSVMFLSLLALTHLFGSLEGDGCVPGGLAAQDMCLRALSLCRCRQGWDDLTHHNAVPQCVVPLPLCAGQRRPALPCCLAQRGSPGPGTDPHLSGRPGDPWLGLVDSSNPIIKLDDIPSLCVRPPSLEQFSFLPGAYDPISQPGLTDFCKRSRILAFVPNSV